VHILSHGQRRNSPFLAGATGMLMNAPSRDIGIIAALMRRLNTEVLPSMFKLRKKVESGERLSEGDIYVLRHALANAKDANLEPLLGRHPEYRSLVGSLFSLYRQVVDRALENELHAGQAGL
jgi:hypothetical protein